jgi:hypothetical protein
LFSSLSQLNVKIDLLVYRQGHPHVCFSYKSNNAESIMMKFGTSPKLLTGAAFGFLVAGMLGFAGTVLAAKNDATVINLTQIGCQFLESENGVNHRFDPISATDCKAINAKTGADRLGKAKVFKLKPGKYIFRVKNENVPYTLGFWLRDKEYSSFKPWLQSVSGGGLDKGVTRDYEITLKSGAEYLYSCPLNPTPDYRIVVQ